MSKKTPLYDDHVSLGARIVEFAGWQMPVMYKGIIEEHTAVRTHVGLFDVSHMGEVFFEGPNALSSLQWLTTNDVSKLEEGDAQYSLLPNKTGGVVDDIIVYCLKKNARYLVCVNAANTEKDFKWMIEHNRGAVVKNESSSWGQIAVQGPKALELGSRVFGDDPTRLKSFTFFETSFNGVNCIVARTGYTGESGFEVFVPTDKTASLWREFLKNGADLGVQPIGLGARDSLRTEMKYSLYGHELTDSTSPLEARLGWAVKLNKGDFIGRAPMAQLKERGLSRELVGFKMKDKGIPRQDYDIYSLEGDKIGTVTSGTMSPTLAEPIGIGYVPVSLAGEGSEFLVDIRGRRARAHVVKTPFIKE